MVTELSDAFLYAQSTSELWKEITERYGQSNGPLNINGLPTCDCGKMRECTCDVLEKFMLRDSNSKLIQFLMKLNDDYESVRSQILAMDPLPTANMNNKEFNNARKENRGSRVNGKKAKKQGRMAANVTVGFHDHFSGDTPFDLNTENEIEMHQGGGFDQKLGHSSVSKFSHIPLYKSMDFSEFSCESLHQKSVAYTPQQNGRVERMHRHLLDIAKALRLQANLPLKFSGDCILSATYLINKMPVKILDWKSPYESLYEKTPTYDHLRVIGCLCYAANVKPHKDQFKNRGVKCVLIGYPVNQKVYNLYNWEKKEVFLSRDVVFEEQVFLFKQLDNGSNKQSCLIYLVFDTHPLKEIVIPNTPLPETTHTDHLDNNEPTVKHVKEPITRPPIPSHTFVPVTKSTRSSTRPTWLQDFVTPAKVNSVRFLVYVDDMLLTGNSQSKILSLKNSLDKKFTIKDLGLAKYFLGIELCKTYAGMHLNRRKFILDLLIDAGLTGTKPSPFPLLTQLKLSLDKGTIFKDVGVYRRLAGRLLYLNMTKPDISYVVQHLSQFVSAPKDVHMQAALHLLRYLKGTISKGLFYHVQPYLQMTGFSDADLASCLMAKRSLTSYCIFLGHSLVYWKTKKQPTVSRSSIKADYRSMAATTCELLWLSFLLKDLHIQVKLPVTLFCDNKLAQQIAANPCFHDQTKHLDIDCYFTRDKIQEGFLQTAFIPTHLQLADVMTKSLGELQHTFLVDKLGLTEAPT
uniref:Uncharacterized protein n=1 Tax=Tanacetum cinerariifolium TaxID=118510 RepID=A0A699HE98_TANCI|nr:hypothetical protein CTI12_AA091260 [Tanacetum cinerariifolium]